MTPKEAFKVAFLQKCAAAGLDDAQVLERIRTLTFAAKAAQLPGIEKVSAWYDWIINPAKAVGGFALNKALPFALIAPPVAGALGGYAISKMEDGTLNPEEAQRREELAEMQRAVQRLRRLQQMQLAKSH